MAKIALTVVGGHGHVNPTLALAEELVRRGHDVIYCTTDEFRDQVEALGACFRGYDSLLANQERPKIVDPHTVPKRFLMEALHTLPQIDLILKEEMPDLLLYDNLCLAGRILSEVRGIKSGALFTSYAGSEQFNIMQGLGELPSELQAECDALMTEICAQYGSQAFPFASIASHGEGLNIVFMPRMWQPHSESFDERYVFVGPCLGTRAQSDDIPADFLEKSPLLLISLGTVFNERPEFYCDCFKAFEGTDWNVIMVVGRSTDLAMVGDAPANFQVKPHVSQIEILRHATAFLSHGGMNSTMEAMSLGVPLIAVPQMFEQAATAHRIGELGVGMPLDTAGTNPDQLLAAVEHAAKDPEIRRNVNLVQAAVNSAGGVGSAADAVDAYLAKVRTGTGKRPIRSVRPETLAGA